MRSHENNTELVQKAVKAGLNMREVYEKLNNSVTRPDGLESWREWLRALHWQCKSHRFESDILHQNESTLRGAGPLRKVFTAHRDTEYRGNRTPEANRLFQPKFSSAFLLPGCGLVW